MKIEKMFRADSSSRIGDGRWSVSFNEQQPPYAPGAPQPPAENFSMSMSEEQMRACVGRTAKMTLIVEEA